jgi:uncharacterized protein involved in response to NO
VQSLKSQMSLSDQSIAPKPRPGGGIPRLRPGSVPLLSYGFRPFFLGAAVWACIGMVLWIGLLSGAFSFARTYGAVAWHAHELLFGYVSAVMTGFLLTAIPNWTGRMPLQGQPLLTLALLWLGGRVAMLLTDSIGNVAAAAADSAYLFVLTAVIAREIVAGKNWRNLKVTILTSVVAAANVVFHAEVIFHGAPDYGVRIGIAAVVTLIMLIGGRVTPSFTHNWLARRGDPQRPVSLGRFDFAAIGVMAVGLICWIVAPEWIGTGAVLLVGAGVQAVRLSRWTGLRTWREPIVLILHVGYAFVPLGALTLAVSILWPSIVPPAGALHAWTSGAIGVMTLAIMTRATLGHTGRPIETAAMTGFVYAAIVVATLARIAAPMAASYYSELLYVAAVSWIAAFGAFTAWYGPMLIRARRPG